MSDAAVATIVAGILQLATIISGVVVLWIKQRKSEKKIDHNTQLTKAGSAASVTNSRVAANAATEASTKADALAVQFNGAMDERITRIVTEQLAPINAKVTEHAAKDERDHKAVLEAINKITSGK